MGQGSTIWTGSAFKALHCYELVLLHSRFHLSRGAIGSCNNRVIVARSVSVEDNHYTSQLNVTVIPDIVGKTIECTSDNGTYIMLIFSLAIPKTGLSFCITITSRLITSFQAHFHHLLNLTSAALITPQEN